MKKSKLHPKLAAARNILIRELNEYMKHGSASDGIDIIVPAIMPALHIDWSIHHNDKPDQYGVKVVLSTEGHRLTLKF